MVNLLDKEGLQVVGRIVVDDVTPEVSGGKYPAKGVVGENIVFSATIWREGHDAVGGSLVIRSPKKKKPHIITLTPGKEPDTFRTLFTPDCVGLWSYHIEGWSDPYTTWRNGITKKIAADFSADQLFNELEIGARLFEQAAQSYPVDKQKLLGYAEQLRDDSVGLYDRTAATISDEIIEYFRWHPIREFVSPSKTYKMWVDRKLALFSSWYEFFPRSTGGVDQNNSPIHGTFRSAAGQLPRIAEMGFNVVYLPPIHPIGLSHRKGPNNTLDAGPNDVGSPWAIGSSEGGHDAIHPQLGDICDFHYFIQEANNHGIEVALDFALQCSPDHPWVTAHPEWFTQLPDNTIAYAENPPKKYQDIYPINFDNDPEGIYAACLEVLLFWVNQGVTIFRVDNPHTKPANFWEWLISQVKQKNPTVIFLSEAFTRPARLYGLAKVGFSQSYTYFTWRTSKYEIIEFAHELVKHSFEARPNLFTNTPDILPDNLTWGGPGMFAIRACLAATLSPSWGIYSGFELGESTPLRPGSEEYLHSEKYELRPRDFLGAIAHGNSLEPWLTMLNHLRNENPALQQLRNIFFHHTTNEALIAYSKFDATTGNNILVIVNINPFGPEEGLLYLDLPRLGLEWESNFEVFDEISHERYWWKAENYIRLDPVKQVCHIIRLPLIPENKRLDLS